MDETVRSHVIGASPGRGARPTAAQVIALVERAARIPDGLALLEASPLECAAVLLGVDPRTLERVRAALADPQLHEEVRLAFAHLVALRPPPRPEAPPAPVAAPRDPEALLAAAARRPGGDSLLLSAAAESAAVLFGVHPDLVLQARELAARRGLPRDPSVDA